MENRFRKSVNGSGSDNRSFRHNESVRNHQVVDENSNANEITYLHEINLRRNRASRVFNHNVGRSEASHGSGNFENPIDFQNIEREPRFDRLERFDRFDRVEFPTSSSFSTKVNWPSRGESTKGLECLGLSKKGGGEKNSYGSWPDDFFPSRLNPEAKEFVPRFLLKVDEPPYLSSSTSPRPGPKFRAFSSCSWQPSPLNRHPSESLGTADDNRLSVVAKNESYEDSSSADPGKHFYNNLTFRSKVEQQPSCSRQKPEGGLMESAALNFMNYVGVLESRIRYNSCMEQIMVHSIKQANCDDEMSFKEPIETEFVPMQTSREVYYGPPTELYPAFPTNQWPNDYENHQDRPEEAEEEERQHHNHNQHQQQPAFVPSTEEILPNYSNYKMDVQEEREERVERPEQVERAEQTYQKPDTRPKRTVSNTVSDHALLRGPMGTSSPFLLRRYKPPGSSPSSSFSEKDEDYYNKLFQQRGAIFGTYKLDDKPSFSRNRFANYFTPIEVSAENNLEETLCKNDSSENEKDGNTPRDSGGLVSNDSETDLRYEIRKSAHSNDLSKGHDDDLPAAAAAEEEFIEEDEKLESSGTPTLVKSATFICAQKSFEGPLNEIDNDFKAQVDVKSPESQTFIESVKNAAKNLVDEKLLDSLKKQKAYKKVEPKSSTQITQKTSSSSKQNLSKPSDSKAKIPSPSDSKAKISSPSDSKAKISSSTEIGKSMSKPKNTVSKGGYILNTSSNTKLTKKRSGSEVEDQPSYKLICIEKAKPKPQPANKIDSPLTQLLKESSESTFDGHKLIYLEKRKGGEAFEIQFLDKPIVAPNLRLLKKSLKEAEKKEEEIKRSAEKEKQSTKPSADSKKRNRKYVNKPAAIPPKPLKKSLPSSALGTQVPKNVWNLNSSQGRKSTPVSTGQTNAKVSPATAIGTAQKVTTIPGVSSVTAKRLQKKQNQGQTMEACCQEPLSKKRDKRKSIPHKTEKKLFEKPLSEEEKEKDPFNLGVEKNLMVSLSSVNIFENPSEFPYCLEDVPPKHFNPLAAFVNIEVPNDLSKKNFNKLNLAQLQEIAKIHDLKNEINNLLEDKKSSDSLSLINNKNVEKLLKPTKKLLPFDRPTISQEEKELLGKTKLWRTVEESKKSSIKPKPTSCSTSSNRQTSPSPNRKIPKPKLSFQSDVPAGTTARIHPKRLTVSQDSNPRETMMSRLYTSRQSQLEKFDMKKPIKSAAPESSRAKERPLTSKGYRSQKGPMAEVEKLKQKLAFVKESRNFNEILNGAKKQASIKPKSCVQPKDPTSEESKKSPRVVNTSEEKVLAKALHETELGSESEPEDEKLIEVWNFNETPAVLTSTLDNPKNSDTKLLPKFDNVVLGGTNILTATKPPNKVLLEDEKEKSETTPVKDICLKIPLATVGEEAPQPSIKHSRASEETKLISPKTKLQVKSFSARQPARSKIVTGRVDFRQVPQTARPGARSNVTFSSTNLTNRAPRETIASTLRKIGAQRHQQLFPDEPGSDIKMAQYIFK